MAANKLISAACHIVEPPEMYTGRMEPRFRDRAPKMERRKTPSGRNTMPGCSAACRSGPSAPSCRPDSASSAAAAVTTRLKLGTAVCLVIQRDTIQTAKLVASLDQVSKGRFLFGVGCGWNAEEMENHGTVYETRTKKMREQIEAMKEIWTKETSRNFTARLSVFRR
jgi:alkanesulfonate monooxygenase SsuD/methylene tetrahydromethanopterin reductase-like flavin-dependent oxidoreductase (luciferase family)